LVDPSRWTGLDIAVGFGAACSGAAIDRPPARATQPTAATSRKTGSLTWSAPSISRRSRPGPWSIVGQGRADRSRAGRYRGRRCNRQWRPKRPAGAVVRRRVLATEEADHCTQIARTAHRSCDQSDRPARAKARKHRSGALIIEVHRRANVYKLSCGARLAKRAVRAAHLSAVIS